VPYRAELRATAERQSSRDTKRAREKTLLNYQIQNAKKPQNRPHFDLDSDERYLTIP
jgi:hypothetical protein